MGFLRLTGDVGEIGDLCMVFGTLEIPEDQMVQEKRGLGS
jgi:hypothetical protein